jgi:hypothetical protein
MANGAVLAKDMDRETIAEAAIPVLAYAQYAAALGRAARARVKALFLQEHFMERFRRALSPLIFAVDSPRRAMANTKTAMMTMTREVPSTLKNKISLRAARTADHGRLGRTRIEGSRIRAAAALR